MHYMQEEGKIIVRCDSRKEEEQLLTNLRAYAYKFSLLQKMGIFTHRSMFLIAIGENPSHLLNILNRIKRSRQR